MTTQPPPTPEQFLASLKADFADFLEAFSGKSQEWLCDKKDGFFDAINVAEESQKEVEQQKVTNNGR